MVAPIAGHLRSSDLSPVDDKSTEVEMDPTSSRLIRSVQSQSFFDFDRSGRTCDHLGLDTLSLKKNLASCSILLRLYTPGLTPPSRGSRP